MNQDVFEEIWSFHPLDVGEAVIGGVPPTLENADVVITDYSSIVYEAYLLGKPVFFYTPDLEHYMDTPGLNANPVELSPTLVAETLEELVGCMDAYAKDPTGYDWAAFETFVGQSFEGAAKDPAQALVTRTGSCE